MNEKNINIQMIKTYYPHWGKHTAFNSFVKYFDQHKFNIDLLNVPVGDENFRIKILPLIKYLKIKIKKNEVQEYRLNDLVAELSVFYHSFNKQIDVIHFLDGEHSLMFLPKLYRKIRYLKTPPKIIAMFHQPPSVFETYPLINMRIVKQVDHILVVSTVQAEYFEQFIPHERISTVLLGVDTNHYKPVLEMKRRTTFKCLAGGVWLRDYETLMKIATILEKHPAIEFHVVASRFTDMKIPKNMFFHEGISDDALLKLYRSSQTLVMPFIDATANTFLLEGAACGLPVISSDITSVRAYFPGEEAILIPENDPGVFAETLIELYENPDKLQKMSLLARKRALELSWENVIKEYQRMYLNLYRL